MKKLLTLLGLTSLTLSGASAFTSYLAMPKHQTNNEILASPQPTTLDAESFAYPQVSAFSLADGPGLSTAAWSGLVNPQVDLIDIEDVISVSNIGTFRIDPTPIDVLTRLKRQNPELDETQVQAEQIGNGQVTLRVVPDSFVYNQGEMILTYTIVDTRDLWDDLMTDNLGQFLSDPTINDVLKRLGEQSPDLILDEVTLTIVQATNQVILEVRPESTIYSQVIVSLTYNIVDLRELPTDLTVTNIGTFVTDPSEQEVLQRIGELNPNLVVAEIHLIEHRGNSVTVAVNAQSIVYRVGPSIRVFYGTEQLTPLPSVVVNTNLGEFEARPTDQDLLDELALLNPRLDINEVHIEDNANNQASLVVNAGSTVYAQGSILVRYTVNGRTSMEDVITNTDLGDFPSEPTDEDIMDRIGELNPNLDLNEVHLERDEEGHVRLVVNEDSDVYEQGETGFDYTVTPPVVLRELTDDLTNSKLGIFNEEVTANVVIERVKALNPNVDETQIEVVFGELEGFAAIRVIADSTVYNPGEITVTFEFIALRDLRGDIVENNLGTFTETPSDAEALARLVELNPDIDLNEVEVTYLVEQIILRVKPGSQIYNRGASAFRYGVLHSLNDELTQTDLGVFYGAPSARQVLNRIREINRTIAASELVVTINGRGEATVSVLEGSMIYAQSSIDVFYQVVDLIDLSELLPGTDEISIRDFKTTPTGDDILLRISDLFPEVIVEELWVGEIWQGTARVSVLPTSRVYKQHTFIVSFVVDAHTNLGDALITRNLGQFETQPDAQMILTRVKQLNPTVLVDQLYVSSFNGTKQAIVSVAPGSAIYNQANITVSFTVNENPVLNQVIRTTNLGEFPVAPNAARILARARELNPGLDISQVHVTNIGNVFATIVVNNNSWLYRQSSVLVRFAIDARPTIQQAITVRSLGIFDTAPNMADILLRLKELNPALFLSQIRVTNIAARSATLVVIPNSTIYQQGAIAVTFGLRL